MRTAAGKRVRCKVDTSRRVRIPAALCRELNIHPGDTMLVRQHGITIEMRKAETSCILCGSETDLLTVGEEPICQACYNKIRNSAGKSAR